MPTPIAPAAPQPNEYDEAIQNPRVCFTDTELRNGKVETYPLGRGIPGMPWPRSGAFGQAYRIFVNGQQWGVKCFTRLHDDQEARYRAISGHLKHANLPYMVDFDFQPTGMRVKGKLYPLLKMAWIDGEPLDDYIERHLSQPGALARLADQWLALVASLHSHGIAHGDLQHGNILVAADELRLIDYDGMFVPALHGQASHEIGHRNYQHPQRNQQQFDDSLDHFSSWVIYISLLALKEDPSLWSRFGGGDEKLLFDADDLRTPERSPVLAALRDSSKLELRPLAAFISELARVPPTHVQPLDSALVTRATQEARLAWINDARRAATIGRAASPPASAPTAASARPPATAPAAAWLEDHRPVRLAPPKLSKLPPKPWLPATLWPERLGVILQLATSGALTYLASLGLILSEWAALWFGSTLAMMFILLAYRYVSLPEFRERSDLLTQRARLQRDQRQNARRLARLTTAWEREEKRGQAAGQALDATEAKERTRRAAALQTVDLELQTRLAGRLQRWQQQKRQEALTAVRLADEVIPSIGLLTQHRLTRAGIVSAADVDYARVIQVPFVGDQRARELMAWRRQVEARIAPTLPTALPADQVAPLHKEAARARERIELRHRKPLARATQNKQTEAQRHAQEQQKLAPAISEEKRLATDLDQQLVSTNHSLTAYETMRFATFMRRLFFLRG